MKRIVKKFIQMFIQSFRNKERIDFIVRLAVFSAMLFFLFYFINTYLGDRNYLEKHVKMSIYNDGSSGTSALKEFLSACGIKVGRILKPLIRDINHKSNKKGSYKGNDVILIFEPETIFSPDDVEIVNLRAKQGATIMIFTGYDNKIAYFLQKKKAKYSLFAQQTNKYFITAPRQKTKIRYDCFRICGDVNSLELVSKKRFKKYDKHWRIMLEDKYGPIALYRKISKGKVILFSDAQFASNYYIRKQDNCIFIYRLIKYFMRKSPVYFNEYYHGFQKRYTLLYFAASKKSLNIILQIFLFFGFVFLASGVRFGQLKSREETKQQKIYYYSEGMSNLLAKRGYRTRLFDMMLKNYMRISGLKASGRDKAKLMQINKLKMSLKNKKTGIRDLNRLYKIIRNII